MSNKHQEAYPRANRINTWLVVETFGVFALLSLFVCWLHQYFPPQTAWLLHFPLLLFQGFWFYRFYIAGHEASHRKLFPGNRFMNDFWGSVLLLPLMTPVNIFRKIHMYHHGFNRRDPGHSSLDTFVLKPRSGTMAKLRYRLLWIVSVFMGGFFLHSFVSVILFLFVPVKYSTRISPAFEGWTWRDQLTAIGLFFAGVVFHLSIWQILGKDAWLYAAGYPILVFAWILSMMVYIFHYDTTTGPETRFHARRVNHVPVISWVLMNFNEHATHHQYPNIPWYELPMRRTDLPPAFAVHNQKVNSMWKAILQQLKGPRFVIQDDSSQR